MADRSYLALGVYWVAVAAAAACGGSIESDANSGADGAVGGKAGFGGGPFVGGSGGAPFVGGSGGLGGGKDGGKPDAKGGTGGYVDPGCPDAAPPPPEFDCDPLGPNTCGPGDACYPWVEYPSKPCEFERYGASCSPQGSALQGEACGYQPGYVILCAPGHSCVLTGQGTECVQVCDLFGPSTCPKGLFCVPIDVEGIGGCY